MNHRQYLKIAVLVVAVQLGVAGLTSTGQAAEACMTSLQNVPAGFDFEKISTAWQEVGNSKDSQPLNIRLVARGNQIQAIFEKSNEGVWFDGIAEICRSGNNFTLKLARIQTKAQGMPGLKWALGSENSLPLKMSADRKRMEAVLPVINKSIYFVAR